MVKKEYKSPNHKLINFFEESRDAWKDRALKDRILIGISKQECAI